MLSHRDTSALRIQQLGTLTHLELPDDLTWDEYDFVGDQIQNLVYAWQWFLGDWMLYGEKRFGEDAYQAVNERLGIHPETRKRVTWVCSRVAPERRRSGLRFSIHERVAALEPGEQNYYLDLAEEQSLSVSELTKVIKRDHLEEEPAFNVEPVTRTRWVECPNCAHGFECEFP